ncbi:hypothetical protein C8Q80DRAFT_341310 [Daedaleopsis nitida]|nr:hypothetical protein C8Q80DRAFT_341310 [Daedaleopsis nitida]
MAMAYDDDDGMPPLVDNPLPPMTFTFSAHLPPITGSMDWTSDDMPPLVAAPEMPIDSPLGTPMLGPTRASHAKRRDASYIPRPPNAFILFRSSFIRAQHIPGQIEGNHSALSKIIGKCWKALPREEREVWEAKAVVALAEHRRKYPDWRFKHAANALAKVKDGPRKRGNRKGRGQSEKEERSREKRCAKIADLLVAGKTGSDLAAAVKEYDDGEDVGRGRKLKEGVAQMPQGDKHDAVSANADVKVQAVGMPQVGAVAPLSIPIEREDVKPAAPRSAIDGRFSVPLTAMFKRSSSAPAPRARTPSGELEYIAAPRRDSFSAALPSYTRATSFDSMRGEPLYSREGREGTGHVSADSVSSPVQAFSPAIAPPRTAAADEPIGGGANGNANDVSPSRSHGLNSPNAVASPLPPPSYLPHCFRPALALAQVEGDALAFAPGSINEFSSPPMPAFELELELDAADALSSPAASPVATPVMYGWGLKCTDVGTPTSISDLMGEAYAAAPSPSSYSSLEGWAGPAGSPLPAPNQGSPTSSPLAKLYDYADGREHSPGVMEKAFDAAAYACDWDMGMPGTYGLGSVGPTQSPYAPEGQWAPDFAFSTYALPGAALHCRQDDF